MTVPDIHRNVLDNLSDGVLVVGPGGRIETLNPAAERILGLEPGQAAGCGFGELFVTRDGFDDFTQLILDATAQRSGPERLVVEVRGGGDPRSLSVATSYLRAAPGDSGARAVIAVFSDVTELRELRETELRMAKAVEEQHGKLQGAYREIEDRNEALAAALRKVRVAQGLGFVLVIGLFLGVGLLNWRPLELFADIGLFEGDAVAVAEARGEGTLAFRTLAVEPRRVSSSIVLKGRLAPWREADVRSPVEATVAAVHVRLGQEVAEGDILVTLDLTRLDRKYQSARLKFLKAQGGFETIRNWDASAEMTKARRTLTKARLGMDGQKNKIRKSRFLFEQGLMAAAEFEDAERQHKSQLLDFQAAEEEFAAAKAKGDKEALTAARLAMENARTDMLELEGQLKHDRIVAPLAGVVLPPLRKAIELAEGAKVRKDAALFRIGNFSRIAAAAQADEIDVVKLRAGQKVTVTGNAFPGLELRGEVTHVSSQADPKNKRTPRFDVAVLLDEFGKAQKARLRAGMSGKLRIVTYSNPKALLVPLDAVRRRGGKHWLRVLDPETGEPKDREVGIGPTTLRKVEIASGLKPGERVVLPGG